LERRIKHHVVGPVQSFYAVTAPGIEPLCRAELDRHTEAAKITGIEKGGVAFQGRLHDIYSANLLCRTAHRFLMRIGEFRAETFEALTQKTRAVAWELYLPPGAAIEVKVSTHRSRLYHSGAVAERLLEAIRQRMGDAAAAMKRSEGGDPRQRIYARLDRDRCLLSIDSSGANLHKRGLRAAGGRAPLRETLAAAVLLRAGYSGREVLCDPMCGSGTFAIEAALMAKQIPPGWFREFAFEDWPSFRPGRWRHIRRTASPPETHFSRPLIMASDRNASAARQLKETIAAHGLEDTVRVDHHTFEQLSGPALSPTGGIVVLNPPYGRRLGSRRSAEQSYKTIGRHLKSGFRGWKAAVLAPSRRLADLLGIRARRYVMTHGGQRVHLMVGTIRA
jgi:putative N6-adenine-specific DNA methylase